MNESGHGSLGEKPCRVVAKFLLRDAKPNPAVSWLCRRQGFDSTLCNYYCVVLALHSSPLVACFGIACIRTKQLLGSTQGQTHDDAVRLRTRAILSTSTRDASCHLCTFFR